MIRTPGTHNFVALCLMLSCAMLRVGTCEAQVKTGDADSMLIPYSRSTPKAVLRLMPRGARSLFWGKFSPSKNTQLAVHIFSPKKKLKATDGGSRTYTHFYEVNLFQLSRGVFRKISHVAFTRTLVHYGYDQKYDYTDKCISKLHWLLVNKGKKDVPIIAFDYFTNDTEAGFPCGDGTFLVFDSTWKSGKQTGNFSFGWTGGAGSEWGYEVVRDEQGELVVLNHEGDMNGNSNWSYSYEPNKREFIKGGVTHSPRGQ